MKFLFNIVLSLFISISAFAQTADAFVEINIDEVPNEVLLKFKDMESDAVADSWRVEDRTYEVKFLNDGNWTYYRFDDSGSFLESRVQKKWDNNTYKNLEQGKERTMYKYWDVVEFYEVNTALGEVYYVLQLESDKTDDLQTLYFDDDGSLRDKSKSGY